MTAKRYKLQTILYLVLSTPNKIQTALVQSRYNPTFDYADNYRSLFFDKGKNRPRKNKDAWGFFTIYIKITFSQVPGLTNV